MARPPKLAQSPLTLALACLLLGVAPDATAQDRPNAPEANQPREREGRDRRTGWDIPDDATSENNRTLERVLKRYPESDADKDGKLNAEEARAFIEKQRERWRERGNWRRNRVEPTFDNVKYGPADKHHFDLYRANTEEPAPLVVFFHGGQFITGDERSTRSIDLSALLAAGISVASIDYRETNEEPFPGPFDDAAQAIKFIRFYAEQLHIDPTRIAGIGDEAGGNLALYLALHDDQFDQDVRNQLKKGEIDDPRETLPEGPIQLPNKTNSPKQEPEQEQAEDQPEESDQQPREFGQVESKEQAAVESLDDLVLEDLIPWDAEAVQAASTTLVAVVARHPISTFDPRAWDKHKLPMNDHERLMGKYLDVRYLDPLNDPEVIQTVEQVSPLALIDGGDPPVLLTSQYQDLPLTDQTVWTIMRHHPKQSQLIASAMRAKGNEAIVRYKGMKNDPGISSTDFLINRLK